jgi:hypothetical protein
MKKKFIPAVPSSDIPETGFILMSHIRGSSRFEIPAYFEEVSRPTLYTAMKEGRFPQPVKIGRVNAWPARVIKAFVAQLEAQGEPVSAQL